MNQTWHNRSNTSQLLDFSHLSYDYGLHKEDSGPLHPTDIDACFEIHSTPRHPLQTPGILFAEYKCRDQYMAANSGQAILLETLARLAAAGGYNARVLEVGHYVYDADQDIDAGACLVHRIYDGKAQKWIYPPQPITVAEYMERFIDECRRGAA